MTRSDWWTQKSFLDTCSFLENDGTIWKTLKMTRKRKSATTVALNKTTLWIIGGMTFDINARTKFIFQETTGRPRLV